MLLTTNIYIYNRIDDDDDDKHLAGMAKKASLYVIPPFSVSLTNIYLFNIATTTMTMPS